MKKSARIGMRVEPEIKHEWEACAAAAGMTLSQWINDWLQFGATYDTIKKQNGKDFHS